MRLTNTLFRSKRIHRETWWHAPTDKWKRVDYICTTKWMFQFVRSCRVFIGPTKLFSTDHRLLVMNMEFPVSKRTLNFHLSRRPHREMKSTADFNALMQNVELQIELTQALDDNLTEMDDSNVDTTNECIVNAGRSSVEEVVPKVT